jgi:hypothetical protein
MPNKGDQLAHLRGIDADRLRAIAETVDLEKELFGISLDDVLSFSESEGNEAEPLDQARGLTASGRAKRSSTVP